MSARDGAREPLRTCVGCKRVRPRRELVRLVARDGSVVLDRSGRAAGRGAYVCADVSCARAAAPRVARALRAPGIETSALKEEMV